MIVLNRFREWAAIIPRIGTLLRVLIIARISTVHQDERSLDDQVALCEHYVADRFEGPVEFVVIQGRGSGELLDREELLEAEKRVESRSFDFVVVEDIGRICRRSRAFDFCELCEDADTRLIAINDLIDTGEDNWRLNALFASFKHESGNKDTANRIRRSLRNRFVQGGVVQTLPYGYIKPLGTKSDDDIQKMTEAQPIYDEIFQRLEDGASYSELADWLNQMRVPTGEWMRCERWTGRAVSRLIHNPILKGYRRRNERMSRRINFPGGHKSVKAPREELLYRIVPRLAFIELDRYDRLIAHLAANHDKCARGRKAGTADGRAGVSKKDTVWPGQHITCGVCGRIYYWGGHGQADHLMCSGARDYACWNGATFDGAEAARRLANVILVLAEELPEFEATFLARAEANALALRSAREEVAGRLDLEARAVDREIANIVNSLAQIGYSPALQTRLAETEGRRARLGAERAEIDRAPREFPSLPPIAELKSRAREAVGRLAFDDPKFGRLMHLLAPRIVVKPYQPLDGGAVVLRARMDVNFAPLLGSGGETIGDLIARKSTVDLFDPPQRVAFREQVVELRGRGITERKAAETLGLTITATQRAMKLNRTMDQLGMTDPYRCLTEPPQGDGKLRRHLHKRYCFQPLDGYSSQV